MWKSPQASESECFLKEFVMHQMKSQRQTYWIRPRIIREHFSYSSPSSLFSLSFVCDRKISLLPNFYAFLPTCLFLFILELSFRLKGLLGYEEDPKGLFSDTLGQRQQYRMENIFFIFCCLRFYLIITKLVFLSSIFLCVVITEPYSVAEEEEEGN